MKSFPWIIVATVVAGCGAGSTSSPMLSCEPQSLTPRSTLTLTLAPDHPAELAIRTPDGIDLFLVYDRDASMPPGLRPIMEKQTFKDARTLALPVATAKGSAWIAGRDDNELIFQTAGSYEVLLTNALESDAGHPVFRCTLQFQP